jgi:hypothetical protein
MRVDSKLIAVLMVLILALILLSFYILYEKRIYTGKTIELVTNGNS